MSYINEIEFDFEPGDAYELSPIEMLYVIGKVRELGGQVYIDGNVLIITEMPGKIARTPQPPVEQEKPAPVEHPAPAPEAETETPQEASAEVSETPSKRGRKPKIEESSEPVTVQEPVSTPDPVEE
jgi:hypothetical protein